MSSSSETNFNLLTRIPNDQYACSDCGCVPEIINLYFESGIIEIYVQFMVKNFYI